MTGHLETEARFPDPDAAYRAIIEAHRGLSDEDSAALNAALVLILANELGRHEALREALALAKAALKPP
jgi:anthranilate phosphoribosyltransferase